MNPTVDPLDAPWITHRENEHDMFADELLEQETHRPGCMEEGNFYTHVMKSLIQKMFPGAKAWKKLAGVAINFGDIR